ncbi:MULTISPECIES: hypothetical protein [Nostocales]|uniref:Lipoprotein n=3 Tax=Nostocales TaxID=1161 RepID=A0A0C1NEY9_9CYAN|nr:hypothetical protein [Tolypothrix bouteillei]KAF3887427.1 hypothetical protein DA73_0400019485 [Tolypothrix bouteillei VB521301]
MKPYFILPLLANIILLVGCTGEPETPTIGQMTNFHSVCHKGNDGKRVAVEGYLTLPTSIKNNILVLRLRQSKNFGSTVIGVSSNFGDEPNKVSPLPLVYKHRDLKIRTHNGQTASYLDKVRVSGKVYFPISNLVEFQCGLSNPLIERSN